MYAVYILSKNYSSQILRYFPQIKRFRKCNHFLYIRYPLKFRHSTGSHIAHTAEDTDQWNEYNWNATSGEKFEAFRS